MNEEKNFVFLLFKTSWKSKIYNTVEVLLTKILKLQNGLWEPKGIRYFKTSVKANADWLSRLPFVLKKYISTIHHNILKFPLDASKKVNENEEFENVRQESENKPDNKLGDVVLTAIIITLIKPSDIMKNAQFQIEDV